MSVQFFFGIPEALLPVDDPIVFYFHAFAFEALLHGGRCFEKLARAQFAGFIDNPMRRNAFFIIAAAHCPAHLPCAAFVAEVSGYRAIGGCTACGDLPYHVVNVIEKVISLFHARWRGLVVFRRFRRKAGGTNPHRRHGSADLSGIYKPVLSTAAQGCTLGCIFPSGRS